MQLASKPRPLRGASLASQALVQVDAVDGGDQMLHAALEKMEWRLSPLSVPVVDNSRQARPVRSRKSDRQRVPLANLVQQPVGRVVFDGIEVVWKENSQSDLPFLAQ